MAKAKTAPRSGKTKTSPAEERKSTRRMVGGIVCMALGLFTFLGYFLKDYWLIDSLCLYVFKGLFGWGFLLVPECFIWEGYILLRHRRTPITLRLVTVALIPLFFGAIIHLLVCKTEYGLDWQSLKSLYLGGLNMETGGLISGLLAIVLKQAVSVWGAIPVLFAALMVMIYFGAKVSLKNAASSLKRHETPDYAPAPERTAKSGKKSGKDEEPRGVFRKPDAPRTEPDTTELPVSEIFAPAEEKRRPFGGLGKKNPIDIPMDEEDESPIDDIPPMPGWMPPVTEEIPPEEPQSTKKRGSRKTVPVYAEPESTPEPPEDDAVIVTDGFSGTDFEEPLPEPEEPVPEKISGKDVRKATNQITKEIENADVPPEYTYPPVTLLRQGDNAAVDGREEVALNRERLETTLHSFGIAASVADITRGPTVTRYDLKLEAGVKISKITNLAGDLALSLGVVSVRIAPIPDKISTVGVEVPNKIVSTVFLRDILDTPDFRNHPSKLCFAIGKDIAGKGIVGNIAKLPHMLIAGTTGSGKSVCMNSLILSLLYKSTPDEVRLIMIDPKMVELGIYNGIPHLYIPVVTDPKKAAGALQWSVVEMMKRYRLFSEVGARDLKGYNEYQRKQGEKAMPSVVIVIDELADLMMTAAKEVEESICRVAQMGRAAGVHLVIATQRPSADVITGLMKANIPSRIAFAVSSALESRIILDNPGAEKLIGMGDMLYAPLGSGKPMRVQGAFVSDEEREEVINFIKRGSEAQYDESIIHTIEKAAASTGKDKPGFETEDEEAPDGESGETNPFADCDELLPQAVDIILDTKQASVSMLQRRLKLGYSRAARLVDQMEELGIVGPFEGSKPRQILITREQWQEMKMTGQSPAEQLMEEQKDDFSDGEEIL